MDGPPIPEAAGYLWAWWRDLHGRRRYGASGPEPVAWADVEAWSRLTCRRLVPWEIDILTHLDDLWLSVQAEFARKRRRDDGGGQ